MHSESVGYSWSYDTAGRATQQAVFMDGTTSQVGYSYLDAGCGCTTKDLQTITYPYAGIPANQVSYTRDSLNRIKGISLGFWDGYQQEIDSTFVNDVQYNLPNGGISQITYPGYEPSGSNSTIIKMIFSR